MIKFGTGGFRGVIGGDFNESNVKLVAQALSEIILKRRSKKSVVIGFDNRFGSDYFAAWIAQTLAANGIECLLYTEPMPSPAVMTAVRDEKLDYGVMITASHNPYYFNGVKLFVKGGMDADAAFTDTLESCAAQIKEVKDMPLKEARERKLIKDYTNKRRYLDNIKSFLLPDAGARNVKILYDNLCGVGARCIVPLFNEVGIKDYTVLHTEHDAFFGFFAPNPTEQSMEPLKEMVINQGYSFAMATDSDSDRLGIIDEKGNYVSSNDIFACIYYYLVKYRHMKGDVVKNCATSILLDKVANKAGFKCHEVDVGFKNISSGMRLTEALIGGESSGGLTVRGYIYGKDSVFSSLLFTEMVTVINKPVSEIVEEVHRFADYDYRFCEGEIRFASLEELEAFDGSEQPAFDRQPISCERFGRNIKYVFENGCWALLRKSGTEPVLRVFTEFESEEATKYNVERLKDLIFSRTKEAL